MQVGVQSTQLYEDPERTHEPAVAGHVPLHCPPHPSASPHARPVHEGVHTHLGISGDGTHRLPAAHVALVQYPSHPLDSPQARPVHEGVHSRQARVVPEITHSRPPVVQGTLQVPPQPSGSPQRRPSHVGRHWQTPLEHARPVPHEPSGQHGPSRRPQTQIPIEHIRPEPHCGSVGQQIRPRSPQMATTDESALAESMRRLASRAASGRPPKIGPPSIGLPLGAGEQDITIAHHTKQKRSTTGLDRTWLLTIKRRIRLDREQQTRCR